MLLNLHTSTRNWQTFWTVRQCKGSAEEIEENGHFRPESPCLMRLVELCQFNPLSSRCSRNYWGNLGNIEDVSKYDIYLNYLKLKTGRCGFQPSYTASLIFGMPKAPIHTIFSCPSISSLWMIELQWISVNYRCNTFENLDQFWVA